MKRSIPVLFLFLLLNSLLLAQQSPAVSLTVSDKEILIGEPITLTLKATLKKGSDVAFFKIDSIPHFEIQSRSAIDTQRNAEALILTQRMVVTSWDSGRWQVPSYSLQGIRQKTSPVAIKVIFSAFNPEQDYHDIKDVLTVPKDSPTRWYWYVIGALLLAALFILLFPAKKKPAPEVVMADNAYKTAVSELTALQTKAFEKDVKTFYTQLVQILRKYLHQKKGIASYSKTTADLVVPLEELSLPVELHYNLLQALRLSDAVKFARLNPTGAENKEALEIVKESITTIEKAS